MMEDLAQKISRLEESVAELQGSRDSGLAAQISSQLAVVDSLIELRRHPEELAGRYNRLRLEYAALFGDRRMYHSVDRSIRISKVLQDAEHIADAQEFVCEYISSQNAAVDAVAANMAESEAHAGGAVAELGIHKGRVRRRMRVWRCLGAGLSIACLFLFYVLAVR